MSVKQKFIDLVLRGKDLLSPVTSKATEEFKKLQGETKQASDQLKALEKTQAELARAKGLELYAARAAESLNKAKDEVARLSREIDASGKPTKEQAEALKLASRSAGQLQTEYNKLSGQLSKSKSDLQQSGVNTKKLSSEQDRLQKEIQQSSGALQQKRTKLRELGSSLKQTSGSTNSFGESISGATKRLLAFGAAYISINQIKGALTNLFTVGDKFERLDIQLTGVMGSIEAGEQAGSWIKDFAKNTPLQLEQVTETFVRLKNFGLDPMGGVMQSIIDQSEKLGGGYERVQGISLALGQAWAKQKLQGEEILQLIERGVPVWQLLENVTGKNTAELQKLSSAGALGRDVMKQLIDEIGRSAEGQAAKGMNTLSGLISNAKDELEQFYALVANSGALDWLKHQFTEVNNVIEKMTKNGDLKVFAKNISDTVVSAGTLIRDAIKSLFHFREEIGYVAKAWLALKVGKFLGNIVDGAKLAALHLRTLTVVTATTSDGMSKLALTTKSVFRAIGVGLLVEGVVWAVGKLGDLKDAIFDLRHAQNELEKSEVNLANSQRDLKTEYEAVSKAIGIQITNMEQLLQAEREGLIVYDEKLKAYRAVKDEAQKLAEEQKKQVGQLKLTATEAEYAANKILAMSDAYEGAEGTADSLNHQINAVLEVLKSANGEYSTQINQLELLAEKNRQAGAVYEEKQKLLKDTEQAYKALGLTSVKTLEETAAKAQAAFEIISDSSAPLELQRQAFLKWAEAALTSAKATGTSVSEQVNAKAATLGLTEELNKLTDSKIGAIKVTELHGKAHNDMQRDIQQSKLEIEQYRQVLDNASASSETKAKAAKALAQAEQELTGKTKALNEVKQLELATYAQLKLKFNEYTRQMEELDELYRNNGISAAEYLKQKERYVKVLNIIQPMLGGLKDGEKNLQEQTDFANKSLAEQQKILEDLAKSTGKAIQYTSLLANAQQAISQDFNIADKSTQQLEARIRELTNSIASNIKVTDKWWTGLARASDQAFARERQIINETLLIRKYTEQLASSTVTMSDVARISKMLNHQFTELGDSQLAPLRNAITDAENRILSLRDGLQGTFRGLQDELDRLQNNQAAIEKRNYETQLADLNAKLKQAQESNDQAAISAAKQSLALAKEIYAIKTSQIQAEAQSKANSNSATDPAQTTKPRFASEVPVLPRSAIVSNSNSTPSQTVRLELAMPSGSTYQAQMGSNDVNRMLAEIERAASTSL